MCSVVCGAKVLTWWMSQWLSWSGTWTWRVFLSTVRLRWVLSRSSFTVCQWRSSNRLPNDTRSCPPEKELIPENKLEKKVHKSPKNVLLLSGIKHQRYMTTPSLDKGSECFTNSQASNTRKVTLKIQHQVLLKSYFKEKSKSLARLKGNQVSLPQCHCETLLSE